MLEVKSYYMRGPRRKYYDHINSLAVRLFSQFFFFFQFLCLKVLYKVTN